MSETIPYLEILHKRVEVRMEYTIRLAPCKFTDLCQEVLLIVAVLAPDDPRYDRQEVFAFKAIVPIHSGSQCGSATLTF